MVASWLVSVAVTLALCFPVLRLLRKRSIVDEPNHRSSHGIATPRGGGIAVMLGCIAAASLGDARMLAAGATGFGILGLLEDLRGVDIRVRLLAQITIALLGSGFLILDNHSWSPTVILAVVTSGLLVVSYVNAFNFMDGINGISCTQAMIVGAYFALLGHHYHSASLERGGLIVFGATLAFLPFNAPRATMFLGDVGSYFLGGWISLLVVVGLSNQVPWPMMLAPLSIYGIDTFSTIVRRVRRHESPLEPHREHVYQKLSRRFGSHLTSTLAVSAVTAVVSGGGFLAGRSLGGVRVAWLGAVVLIAFGYAFLGWLVSE